MGRPVNDHPHASFHDDTVSILRIEAQEQQQIVNYYKFCCSHQQQSSVAASCGVPSEAIVSQDNYYYLSSQSGANTKQTRAKNRPATTTTTASLDDYSQPVILEGIPRETIELGQLLGEGFFSQVFEIKEIHDYPLDELLSKGEEKQDNDEQHDCFSTDSSYSSSTCFDSDSSRSLSCSPSSSSPLTTKPRRVATRKQRRKLALKCIRQDIQRDPQLARMAVTDLATEANLLGRLSAFAFGGGACDGGDSYPHPGQTHIIRLYAVSSDFYTQPMGRYLILDSLSETLEQRIRQWRQSVSLKMEEQNELSRVMMKDSSHSTNSPCRISGSSIHEEQGRQEQRERIVLVGWQVAQGMAYLHSRNIIFRDLKPANIGLDASDDSVKLFDFALARSLPPDAADSTNNSKGRYCLTKLTGTSLRYLAPEVFQGESYGVPADVYSYALVLYEIITLMEPFPFLFQQREETSQHHRPQQQQHDRSQYEHIVANAKERPPLTNIYFAATFIKELLRSGWHHEVERRPSFEAITKRLQFIIEATNSDEGDDEED